MIISIITLFPEVFETILNTSILKRAQAKGKVEFKLINLRDFGEGRHQVVDDRPYGGGAGMILRADILTKAIRSLTDYRLPITAEDSRQKTVNKIILMSASGKPFIQAKAQEFSKLDHLIIVCGHYEGVDQRFIDKYVDEEISIGDYVLTGGEIPAMVIVDSITRLIPGVLEKEDATQEESYSISHPRPDRGSINNNKLLDSRFRGNDRGGLLEYPHYTRPEEFEGEKVPEVLLSGNHKKIAEWKSKKALEKTKKVRPDLLK